MGCGEAHGSCEFPRAQPDGAGASDQSEGVVADEVGGAFEFEDDGIVGKGADVSELIGNAEDDACCVGSVSDERGVVGCGGKLAVGSAAGECFGDDLLAIEVAVDAEIAPADGDPGSCRDRG